MKTSVKDLCGLSKALGKLCLMMSIVWIMYACHDQPATDFSGQKSQAENEIVEIGVVFAKALRNADLRALIKNETLKKFDDDYDILVQMIAEKEVVDGKTVTQLLQQYSDKDVHTLLRKYPLLSIYIPRLDNFNAETWDVNNDKIPQVAIAQFVRGNNEIRVINSSNESQWISQNDKPEFPVIVLKENERVGLLMSEASSNGRASSIFSNGEFSYHFLNDNGGENADNSRYAASPNFDTKVRSAYTKSLNCSNCYHRDYIYYGISPSENIDQGPFDSHFSEAVTELQFESITALQTVTSNWTEGDLELHIIAMFIGGSSLTQLEKVYHVSQTAFYNEDASHVKTIRADPLGSSPLVLVPWEMNVYGDKWKFNVIEYDPGTTTSVTTSHSTTNSSNFSYSTELSAVIKIGSGYGSSTTTTDSESTTISTTTTSNQLGEAVLNWFDPVITSKVGPPIAPSYYTKTISTGAIILSVEPIRVNP